MKLKSKVKVAQKKEDFQYNTGKFHNFLLKPEMREYEIIDSVEALENLGRLMKDIPLFSFDTETNSLRAMSDNKDFAIADITISWGAYNNYDIIINHLREEDIDRNIDLEDVVRVLKPIFEREDVLIIGHNLKFDMHVMKRIGIEIKTEYLFDTMLASWLCDENTPNGLKENSAEKMKVKQEHFKEVTDSIPNEIKKQFGYKANAKVKDFRLVSIEEGHLYALYDSFYTYCLYLGFIKELEDIGMDVVYYKKMIPFMKVLFDMEEQGVVVNVDKMKEMGESMQEDLEDLQYKIYELSGVEFNIDSPAQKSLLLYGIDDYTVDFDTYLEKYKKSQAKRIAKSGLKIEERRKAFNEKQKDPQRLAILNHCFHFSPTSYTPAGNPSTDNDAMWRIAVKEYPKNKRKQQGSDMCKLIDQYSGIAKLKTAFIDGLAEQLYDDNKAHPNFNEIGTDSGRLSVSNPNLQQLPKAEEDAKYQIRSLFIGDTYFKTFDDNIFETKEELYENGYDEIDAEFKRKKIIAIDYHNLEMVCLTHFSHDKNLSEMFANDDDAHGSTAVNMFNLPCTPVECKKEYPHLRQAAKTINFMLMYGGGAGKLYESLKADHYNPLDLGAKNFLEQYKCRNGVEVAQTFIDKYFQSYSGVAKFIREQKRFAHRNGYVNTVIGRKRRLPDINSSDGEKRSYSERLSVNSAIQGTAADITISGQLRIAKENLEEKYKCKMLIQVHDELVFECPEEYLDTVIPIIKYDMEHPFGDKESQQIKYLRADYDTGDSYQEAK